MGSTVAIIGRPNVGKSTLFNRLIGMRKAIVDDTSGVTRDRQYGVVEWNGKTFNIIDTGGFVPHSDDVFESAIRQQVRIAIDEAALLLFMVDITTGITDLDWELAELLRKGNKPVLVVVNKVDNIDRFYQTGEFYRLGFEEYFPVSSISGSGTGELLDAITSKITGIQELVEDDIPKIAILGQPNVGKSSLLNAWLGTDRNIVTEIAGTTRDTIHSRYRYFKKDLLLIDTAGIRKKNRVKENLEFYSVIRAIKAMDEADVIVLVIDAQLGIEAQDINIFRLAVKKGKGIVIAVNKWDLIDKDTHTTRDYEEAVKQRLAPFTDVPVVFISALEKKRIYKTLDIALEVYQNRKKRIPTSQLNEVMLAAIQQYHPPAVRGKHIKIKYVTQLPSKVPAFAFFCNHPKDIREAYRNYLENQLRQNFDFSGVPVKIYFRKK